MTRYYGCLAVILATVLPATAAAGFNLPTGRDNSNYTPVPDQPAQAVGTGPGECTNIQAILAQEISPWTAVTQDPDRGACDVSNAMLHILYWSKGAIRECSPQTVATDLQAIDGQIAEFSNNFHNTCADPNPPVYPERPSRGGAGQESTNNSNGANSATNTGGGPSGGPTGDDGPPEPTQQQSAADVFQNAIQNPSPPPSPEGQNQSAPSRPTRGNEIDGKGFRAWTEIAANAFAIRVTNTSQRQLTCHVIYNYTVLTTVGDNVHESQQSDGRTLVIGVGRNEFTGKIGTFGVGGNGVRLDHYAVGCK